MNSRGRRRVCSAHLGVRLGEPGVIICGVSLLLGVSSPLTMLVFMGLVVLGIGRLINPLLLFAAATLCFIVLGVREWREEE